MHGDDITVTSPHHRSQTSQCRRLHRHCLPLRWGWGLRWCLPHLQGRTDLGASSHLEDWHRRRGLGTDLRYITHTHTHTILTCSSGSGMTWCGCTSGERGTGLQRGRLRSRRRPPHRPGRGRTWGQEECHQYAHLRTEGISVWSVVFAVRHTASDKLCTLTLKTDKFYWPVVKVSLAVCLLINISTKLYLLLKKKSCSK